MEQPYLQQVSIQAVHNFLLQHNNKLHLPISELIDIMLTGEDQPQANQAFFRMAVVDFWTIAASSRKLVEDAPPATDQLEIRAVGYQCKSKSQSAEHSG
eukprot:1139350-Pelagomonas_calceolata.AAC.3